MILAYTRSGARNVANFNASDPWRENKSARFFLDQCFDGGIMPAYAAFDEESKPHRYALRAENDQQYRALPDSLSALWRTRKVSPEHLPGLLKDLEPGLVRSDYIRLSTMNAHQRAIRTYAVPVYGTLMILLGLPFLAQNDSATATILIGIGMSAIVLPLVIIGRLKARRAQQSNRALSLSSSLTCV